MKVLDNNLVRSATPEEETLINLGGGCTDQWEFIEEINIEEDTQEVVVTFDKEIYDDVLIVGTDINAPKRINAQIRFKVGNYRVAVAAQSANLEGQTNSSIIYRFNRVLDDLYFIDNDLDSTITKTRGMITNRNYIGKKIESVRLNATTNYPFMSGNIKVYAKVRSKY